MILVRYNRQTQMGGGGGVGVGEAERGSGCHRFVKTVMKVIPLSIKSRSLQDYIFHNIQIKQLMMAIIIQY